MDLQLRGRVALVTGGSSGIGRATAVAFGREGANVALTYASDRAAADSAARDVAAAGGQALVARLDLADEASINEATQTVTDRWGGIDVLAANAVRWPYEASGPIAEGEPASWRRAVRVNLEGTAATVRAAWPAISRSGHGRVVLVSTGVTRHGMRGASAYATAKAGLEGLVAALKWKGGDVGILVNVVAPGFTVTNNNLARFGDDTRERVRSRTPSGRLSVPDDVASAIVFLGSAANGNITGAYVRVAGGTD